MGRIWLSIGIGSEMCNAWNHSPSCTCGWGGEGHLGRRSVFDSLLPRVSISSLLRDISRGYVNPNAHCPVCGESVFFYQSPEGGRVFFDSLGPPWPKHPCTDNGRPVQRRAMMTQANEPSNISEGVFQITDGWEPLLLEDISATNMPHVYRLLGLYQGYRREFFTLQDRLQVRAPYFIRDVADGTFQVSTYLLTSSESDELRFIARLFLSDFGDLRPVQNEVMNGNQERRLHRAVLSSVTKPRLQKTQGIRKASNDPTVKKFLDDVHRLAKDGPQPVQSTKKKKKTKKHAPVAPQKTWSLGPTAMQLAFENANKTVGK